MFSTGFHRLSSSSVSMMTEKWHNIVFPNNFHEILRLWRKIRRKILGKEASRREKHVRKKISILFQIKCDFRSWLGGMKIKLSVLFLLFSLYLHLNMKRGKEGNYIFVIAGKNVIKFRQFFRHFTIHLRNVNVYGHWWWFCFYSLFVSHCFFIYGYAHFPSTTTLRAFILEKENLRKTAER